MAGKYAIELPAVFSFYVVVHPMGVLMLAAFLGDLDIWTSSQNSLVTAYFYIILIASILWPLIVTGFSFYPLTNGVYLQLNNYLIKNEKINNHSHPNPNRHYVGVSSHESGNLQSFK